MMPGLFFIFSVYKERPNVIKTSYFSFSHFNKDRYFVDRFCGLHQRAKFFKARRPTCGKLDVMSRVIVTMQHTQHTHVLCFMFTGLELRSKETCRMPRNSSTAGDGETVGRTTSVYGAKDNIGPAEWSDLANDIPPLEIIKRLQDNRQTAAVVAALTLSLSFSILAMDPKPTHNGALVVEHSDVHWQIHGALLLI
jgi:hypothetical protein